MGWLDNPYRHTASNAEDLAYPPNGGRGKLTILGIILPLGLLLYAARIWIAKEAYWPGQHGTGMTVTGDTARAMSAGCAFVGSFFHFRWFWGLIPHYLIFRIGTTVSLGGILVSVVTAFYFLFR